MSARRSVAIGLLLWLSGPALAKPFEPPYATNGECKVYWRSKGYSSESEDPLLRTIFDPKGSETYAHYIGPDRLDRAHCWKQWLIVVYMAGDNDLSPFSYRDIWEMQAQGEDVSVDTVVFHVSAKEKGARYYHVAYTHNQDDYREEIEEFLKTHPQYETLPPADQEVAWLNENGPSLVTSPLVRTLPDAKSADRKSLADFLAWAFRSYPSRRVLFMGWGHGKGFETAPGGSLPVTDVVAELKAQAARHRGGNPVDIAGSDSCLNQQVDYGAEWEGMADYLFGSSTIVQKKGFNYRVLLKWFGEHPNFETEDAAKQIPVIYRGSVTSGSGKKYSSYYDPYATMGVWETSRLTALKASIETAGRALNAWLDAATDPLDKIERRKTLLAEVAKIQRLGGVAYDLHLVLQVLEDWTQVASAASPDAAEKRQLAAIRQAARGVLARLDETVIAKFIGRKYLQPVTLVNPAELDSAGVSIWIPATKDETETFLPRFRAGRFHQGPTEWSRFVAQLFGKK